MSFDTVTFWLFFALAWAAWRYIPFKPAKLVLLLLSLFFYGWWNPWYLLPLAADLQRAGWGAAQAPAGKPGRP